MQIDNLGAVERKALGALIVLANDKKVVQAPLGVISEAMGYKRSGGSVSTALRMLEKERVIRRVEAPERTYELLI